MIKLPHFHHALSHWGEKVWRYGKQGLLVALVELVILQPLILVVEYHFDLEAAQAADTTTTYHDDADCKSYADSVFQPNTSDPSTLDPTPATTTTDSTTSTTGDTSSDFTSEDTASSLVEDGSRFLETISLDDLRNNQAIPQTYRDKLTDRNYIDSLVAYYGQGYTYYKMPQNTVGATPGSEWLFICDNATKSFDQLALTPFINFTPTVMRYLDVLADPTPKLTFKNLADEYAVFGENCAGGFDLPYSQWSTSGSNPCMAFDKTKDDYFSNGQWDAPKVDQRVLDSLVYLVTPTSEGGAGREHIRVKQVIKYSQDNTLDQTPVVTDTSTSTADTTTTSSDTSTVASPSSTPDDTRPSSYWIDPNDSPFKPTNLSHSVMIDEIDDVRVTTKTTTKKLTGSSSTYTYQAPFPVKVAWQTDSGFSQAAAPDFSNLSMLQSSKLLTNSAIVQLLNQWGLGDMEINVTGMDINGLGDVAMVVGKSLLEQLLGTPNGSLKGYNLSSTLESIGLAYLEQNLGLVPGALTDSNPLDKNYQAADFNNIVSSIGRATVEYLLGFPQGSMRTKDGTSQELLESMGRRYLENEVFHVSEGTLEASPGYPLNTVGDLLARLGEGRIEYVFKLPKQSLRKSSYDNSDANQSFRASSYKASLLFPKAAAANAQPSEDDYTVSQYISEQLGLSYTEYNGSGTTMYGFHEPDYNNPSLTLAQSNLQRFKQLVGAQAIENGVGVFRREGSSQRILTDNQLVPSGTISIDGNTIDPALRESYDQPPLGEERDYGWCESVNGQSPKYVTSGSNNSVSFNGSNYDDFIKALETQGGNHDWNDHGMDCSQNNATLEMRDPTLLPEIKDLLTNQQAVTYTELLNTDKEPKKEDFCSSKLDINTACGDVPAGSFNNDDGQYGAHAEWRYLTALMIYYNNPANHKEVSFNTVDPYGGTTTLVPQTDGTTQASQTTTTVAQVLNVLQNGGTLGGHTFAADPSLQARFAMLNDLMTSQTTQDIFNTDTLTGLQGTALDDAVIDRLNLLTAHPEKTIVNFATQYNDPQYNGWTFILQDLQARINCKVQNGFYALASDNTSYTCTPTQTIEGQAATLLNQAASKISEFLSTGQANKTADYYLGVLSTGSTLDQSGLQNQSGFSTSIDQPGQVFKTDTNGRYIKSSAGGTVYDTDLMRALIAPANANDKGVVSLDAPITSFFTAGTATTYSNLEEIGRIYAARTFNEDSLTKNSFAADLKRDFSSLDEAATTLKDSVDSVFDLADKTAKSTGVDNNTLTNKGLEDGDFARIFMLDGAESVFQRVGKNELLRTVWQRTGAAQAITSSSQYQSILKSFQTATQTISFYTTRIDQINKETSALTNEVTSDLKDTDGSLATARKNLQELNQKYTGSSSDNIQRLKNIAQAYEPAINKIRAVASAQEANSILNHIETILHLLEEIAAGRALPSYNQFNFSSGPSSGSKVDDTCFTKAQAIGVFTKGKIEDNLTSLVESVGMCRIDSAFGLPKNSMSNWYVLGSKAWPPDPTQYETSQYTLGQQDEVSIMSAFGTSDIAASDATTTPAAGKKKIASWKANSWNVGNLQLAVGIADYNSRNSSDPIVLNEQLSGLSALSPDRVYSLQQSGEKIIELTILSQLMKLIPGVGTFAAKYQLTTQDLVAIMQGNFTPLATKVGGATIDHALNLPSGTGAQLIVPQCYDNQGNTAPCKNDPNEPGTNPDNARAKLLAQVGLQKLGLTAPDFPRYFDITSGGNLLQNWGNALITEKLGFSPNSFQGNITDVISSTDPECDSKPLRCKNSVTTLMSAFGLSLGPLQQNAQQIRNDIKNSLNGLSITSDSRTALLNEITATTDSFLEKTTLARLYSSDWKNGRGYWADLSKNSGATSDLLTSDYSAYQDYLTTLWQQLGEVVGGPGLLTQEVASSTLRLIVLNDQQAVLKKDIQTKNYANRSTFPDEVLIDLADSAVHDTVAGLLTRYTSQIKSFQTTVSSLNTQFIGPNIAWNATDHVSFQSFLKGDTNAQELTKTTGIQNSVTQVLGTEFDKWIDGQLSAANGAPQWAQDLSTSFKLLTADPAICGKETGFGTFFADVITNKPGSCSTKGLTQGTDLNKLLYSTDSNYTQIRELLFDHYLSNTFADVEDTLGFRHGTFRSIAADPRHANQILIDEGVLSLADHLFGSENKNATCQIDPKSGELCVTQAVTGALRSAFLAGFYDPNSKEPGKHYTLSFNTDRAVQELITYANREVDIRLKRFTKQYLGVEIGRTDINKMIDGDNRFYALIAVQYAAYQLNQQILNGSAARSPNAQYFLIDYNQVRDAVGLFSEDTLQEDERTSKRDYLLTMVTNENCTDGTCTNLNDAQLLAAFQDQEAQSEFGTPYSKLSADNQKKLQQQVNDQLTSAAKIGRNQRLDDKKDAAQKALYYKSLDTAAFLVDQNIPPNFSRRLLSGDEAQRTDALAEYGFNTLLANSDFLKSLCQGSTSANCYAFVKSVSLAFTSDNPSQQLQAIFKDPKNTGFFTLLDGQFNTYFKKQFGITLPTGVFTGIYVWGMYGFRSGDLSKDNLCTPPAQCVPVGRVLLDWGKTELYQWSDKQFGLPAGTTQKIVQVATLLHQAEKVQQSGKALSDADKANVASLRTQAASLAAQIITSTFSDDLRKTDKQLGLPQGTMQIIAAGALTYGIAIGFGASGTAAAAAAFGPAFLIALGLDLVFGVVSVETQTVGTGNGYYPFYNYGSGETSKKPTYSEHRGTDVQVADFDPTKPSSYHAGLERVAREKVTGLLLDLLAMPYSKWAKEHQIDASSLWISQLFTYGGADFNPLLDTRVSYLHSQPTPWDTQNADSTGYGDNSEHCDSLTFTPDNDTHIATCVRKSGVLDGFFPNPQLVDAIHIRW